MTTARSGPNPDVHLGIEILVRIERSCSVGANPLLLHKLRDSTLRANRPAFPGCGESDAVVVFSVQQVPCAAVVPRNMGARRANRDPTIVRPGHGGAKGKSLVEWMPRFAAVGRDRRGGTGLLGLAIVAPDDHAVLRIAEGDRENARGFNTRQDRRFAHLPGLAPILGI